MNFYNVFLSIFTLFAIGITGYVTRKINLIGKEMADNIPKFITHVTMPALIISSMQLPFSWDRLGDVGGILLIAIPAYGLQFLVAGIIPWILGVRKSWDKGVYQFMMIFSNAAFMGFPVLISIFGQESIFYAALFNLPFNALVFTVGVYLMEKGKSKFKLKSLLSPALVGTVIGFMLFIFSVEIPEIALKPLSMVGDLTTPLSMIFIGSSLATVNFKNIFSNRNLYIVSLFRLVIMPVVLLFALKNHVSNELLLGIPVIITAMPVAALCAILAKTYENNVDLASEGTFMTTFFSLFTIPLVVWIFTLVV